MRRTPFLVVVAFTAFACGAAPTAGPTAPSHSPTVQEPLDQGRYTVTRTQTGCGPAASSTYSVAVSLDAGTASFQVTSTQETNHCPLSADDTFDCGTVVTEQDWRATSQAVLRHEAVFHGTFTHGASLHGRRIASSSFEEEGTITTSCEGTGCQKIASDQGMSFPCTSKVNLSGSFAP